MKRYVVYVLQDDEEKYYNGMTSNLTRRLREHTQGHTKTTAKMGDLSVVYKEEFSDRMSARIREKYLKSAAGRKFLKKMLGA